MHDVVSTYFLQCPSTEYEYKSYIYMYIHTPDTDTHDEKYKMRKKIFKKINNNNVFQKLGYAPS